MKKIYFTGYRRLQRNKTFVNPNNFHLDFCKFSHHAGDKHMSIIFIAQD